MSGGSLICQPLFLSEFLRISATIQLRDRGLMYDRIRIAGNF